MEIEKYSEVINGVDEIPEGDLNNIEPEPIKPLLTIKLQDETSVPKVLYRGKEIEFKRNIFFDWDTDTNNYGGLTYAIEHIERDNDTPTVNRIERRVKGHATD